MTRKSSNFASERRLRANTLVSLFCPRIRRIDGPQVSGNIAISMPAHRHRAFHESHGATLIARALAVLSVVLIGCSSPPPARVVTPTGETVADPPPTSRDKEVVVQHLRRDAASSHHFVNLVGSEKPHVHDRSDLTVFILRGSVRMHFEDRVVDVQPGDVVDIPMGAFHWAENTAKEPSLA